MISAATLMLRRRLGLTDGDTLTHGWTEVGRQWILRRAGGDLEYLGSTTRKVLDNHALPPSTGRPKAPKPARQPPYLGRVLPTEGEPWIGRVLADYGDRLDVEDHTGAIVVVHRSRTDRQVGNARGPLPSRAERARLKLATKLPPPAETPKVVAPPSRPRGRPPTLPRHPCAQPGCSRETTRFRCRACEQKARRLGLLDSRDPLPPRKVKPPPSGLRRGQHPPMPRHPCAEPGCRHTTTRWRCRAHEQRARRLGLLEGRETLPPARRKNETLHPCIEPGCERWTFRLRCAACAAHARIARAPKPDPAETSPKGVDVNAGAP